MKYRWIRGGDISSWNQTSFKSNCRYHCEDLRKILFAIESIVFSWKTFTTSTHRSPHAGSAADDDERRDEEEKLILRCGIALAHVEIKLAWKALKTILWELWRGVVPGIRFGGEWEKNFYRFSQIFHFFMEFVPEQLTTLPPTAFEIVGLLLPEHCKEHAHIHTHKTRAVRIHQQIEKFTFFLSHRQFSTTEVSASHRHECPFPRERKGVGRRKLAQMNTSMNTKWRKNFRLGVDE